MTGKLQPTGHAGSEQITKPAALLFVDSTGSYYAGERLSDPEVEQLRSTHSVSEIIWERTSGILLNQRPNREMC